MKKARGDSTLKTLPPARQAEIFALLQTATIASVKSILAKDGLKTSASALSAFFHWYPISRRLEQSVSFANQLKAELGRLPELQGNAEQLEKLAQIAFETRAMQEQDHELYLALKKRRQKDVELALREQNQSLRLRQYEEKMQAVRDACAKARNKGGLSPETLKTIEEAVAIL